MHPFGIVTYETLTSERQSSIAEWLTSLRADSPASPFPSPERKKEQTTNGICGPPQGTPYAEYSPDGACWKTLQVSLLPDTSIPSSLICTRSGMTRDGILYRLPIAAHRTEEIGSGLWPTPRAIQAVGKSPPNPSGTHGWDLPTAARLWPTPATRDWKDKGTEPAARARNTPNLPAAVQKWPTPQARDHHGTSQRFSHGNTTDCLPNAVLGGTKTRQTYPTPASVPTSPESHNQVSGQFRTAMEKATGEKGSLNPDWVEWLMGFPIGWTSLKDLATHRFQSWLQQHGVCLQNHSTGE